MKHEDKLIILGKAMIFTSKVLLACIGGSTANNFKLASHSWVEETPEGLPVHDITFDMIGVSPIDDHLTGGAAL